jgi:hypothetical protein
VRRTEAARRRRRSKQELMKGNGGGSGSAVPMHVKLMSMHIRPKSFSGGAAGGSHGDDTPWDSHEPLGAFGVAPGNQGRAHGLAVIPSGRGMLISGGFPSARYPTTDSMSRLSPADLAKLRFGGASFSRASPSGAPFRGVLGDEVGTRRDQERLGDFFNSLGDTRTPSPGMENATLPCFSDEGRELMPPQLVVPAQQIKKSRCSRMFRWFQNMLSGKMTRVRGAGPPTQQFDTL